MIIVNSSQEEIAKELTLAALDKGLFADIDFSSEDTPESYNVKVGKSIGVSYDEILQHVVNAKRLIVGNDVE